MEKGLNIIETLYVLDSCGVESVNVKRLLGLYIPKPPEETPPEPEPLPPLPPEEKEEEDKEELKVYETFKEAHKERVKGQQTVLDKELGGYVNV